MDVKEALALLVMVGTIFKAFTSGFKDISDIKQAKKKRRPPTKKMRRRRK